jgi:hypothetical protein
MVGMFTTNAENADPDKITVKVTETACPNVCVKPSGNCDKKCRKRFYSEQQTLEIINLRESKALDSAEPVQVAVVDNSKFCAKESVRFKTPLASLNLTNPQKFKGDFSDHSGFCTTANGYSTLYVPPPQPHAGLYQADVITADGCYKVSRTLGRRVVFSAPTVVGPIRFKCEENASTKTMSWKLVQGCKVNWTSTIQFTGVDQIHSQEQIGCFPEQNSPSGPSANDGMQN